VKLCGGIKNEELKIKNGVLWWLAFLLFTNEGGTNEESANP
jgi:hypothetical protein